MSKRNILTIATSKKVYVDMAINLAYSFLHWNGESTLQFYLVTDLPNLIPPLLTDKISIIQVKPGELGESFTTKLQLDKVAPEGQTLFIDSDCLIFGKLDWLFEKFDGKDVSVVGGYIETGEWFGNMEKILAAHSIGRMPKFNGGIYYLQKNDKSRQVYERAREIERRYDEIGFVRLRGKPNDEVIMALSMQLEEQTPVPDDGTIMSDPFASPGPFKLDILSGTTLLTNPPPPFAQHRAWYPFQEVSPVIVHFLGSFTNEFQYKREALKVKLTFKGISNSLAGLMADIMIGLPGELKERSKNILRPLYKRIFGFRKIKTSARI